MRIMAQTQLPVSDWILLVHAAKLQHHLQYHVCNSARIERHVDKHNEEGNESFVGDGLKWVELPSTMRIVF